MEQAFQTIARNALKQVTAAAPQKQRLAVKRDADFQPTSSRLISGDRGGALQRVPRAHKAGQERTSQAVGGDLQLLRTLEYLFWRGGRRRGRCRHHHHHHPRHPVLPCLYIPDPMAHCVNP